MSPHPSYQELAAVYNTAADLMEALDLYRKNDRDKRYLFKVRDAENKLRKNMNKINSQLTKTHPQKAA